MIKQLLSFAAAAVISFSASAETFNLDIQNEWGSAPAMPGTTLIGTSQWGEYTAASNLSLEDYKGCRLVYKDATADGFQLKIVLEDESDRYPGSTAAGSGELSADFTDYASAIKNINIQAKAKDAKVTIVGFYLIKKDGTEVEQTKGSVAWGLQVPALSTPCAVFINNGYGGMTFLKEDGSQCTLAKGSEIQQVYTVTLEEPADIEMCMEADDAKGGIAWSYPNLLVGETSFTLTLNGADLTNDVEKVYLKGLTPSANPVKIKSVTMVQTSTSGISDVIANSDANAPVNVYNIAGQQVRANVAPAEAVEGLAPGFYIVGNKKVLVK